MKWSKLGFVWCGKDFLPWAVMGTLTPTPVILKDGFIRVYCGLRDGLGIGRIGYFDVLERDPTRIVGYSYEPVLEIGCKGAFDDNGMLLGDLILVDGIWRMYYVGFQLATKTKFLAFGGLAESVDNGSTFQRKFLTPVIDRDDHGLYIRAIHCIRKNIGGKGFKAWISEGAGWEEINGVPYPKYNVASIESIDGLNFERNNASSIDLNLPGEYRLGRSRIFSFGANDHILTFTFGTICGKYESGYASSADLINWKRQDDWGLYPDGNGFDSKHLAYPALIRTSYDEIFCFYNGNNMGAEGVGVARLVMR